MMRWKSRRLAEHPQYAEGQPLGLPPMTSPDETETIL
jgi:hypothetical protein